MSWWWFSDKKEKQNQAKDKFASQRPNDSESFTDAANKFERNKLDFGSIFGANESFLPNIS